MPTIQLNTAVVPFISTITLEEPYSLDKWPVKTWDIYKVATKKDKQYFNNYGLDNGSYDFSNCINPQVKDELKYFLSDCIKNKGYTLRTVTSHYSRAQHLIAYVNLHDVESVLDISEEDYTWFLLQNQRIDDEFTDDGVHITSEMKAVPQARRNRTITLLVYIKKVIKGLYEVNYPEQMKDYWKLKNFPFIDKEKLNGGKNLDFRRIPQIKLREQAKKVFYLKIQTVSPRTTYNKLRVVVIFCRWLHKNYPSIDRLSSLNREILEKYFEYLRTKSGYEDYLVNRCILGLKNYLEDGYLMDKENFPEANLILSTDYRIRPARNAEFYSDFEIKNINAIIHELPTLYASIVFCLEILALRISDLLTLTPSMIEASGEGSLYKHMLQLPKKVVKEQQKTGKFVIISIPDSAYRVLMNQIQLSRDKYGEDVKYIFATSKDNHVTSAAASRVINEYFYKYNVLSEDGSIVRFKAHKFRATKATKLIGEGFGAKEAAKALGHSSLQSLSFYMTITDQTLIDSMEPYLKRTQVLIENIGSVNSKVVPDTENLLPLCNGWCCRPLSLGICKHANQCLSCSLFKPDSRHISYYKIQLQELEATLGIAKLENNEALIQKTQTDIAAIERIIMEVEKLCKERTLKD